MGQIPHSTERIVVYDKFTWLAGCIEGICSVCVDNVAVTDSRIRIVMWIVTKM